MRLLGVKCIFLACLATSLTAEETRSKRDLQFLKEVIAAKLGFTSTKPAQKEENVHILRIPNFDQIVVKEVPKFTVVEVPTPESNIRVDPTMDIIGSYLGTKTQEEFFLVQEAVKQLMKMGVLIPNQEVVQLAPPKSPTYVLSSPVEQQKVENPEPRPLYQIKETAVPLPSSVISQVPDLQLFPIPYLQRVIPAPPKIDVQEVRVPVPPSVSVPLPPPVISVPIEPTSYSYRQVHKDGSVTSYLSEANQEVIITETNIPPPPPPAFIINRLQKIVYGKPLGSPVSTPTFSDVVVGPFYPEPLLPIITEPSSVDVKVMHSDKYGTGTNANKDHVISTALPGTAVAHSPIAVDIRTAPLVISSPPIVTEAPPISEDDDNDKYKHVHVDGSASTLTETLSNGESYDIVNFEDISRLPPPPPEILHRIATAAGKAQYKPWGYSLKMSNGVGTYESLNGDKIYYSHLENPDKSDVLPDPLSSPNNDKPKSSNKNIFMVGYGDSELDEYGKPFLSTETNGENNNAVQPNFEPIKKMPPLPMPIAGENQKNTYPHSIGAAKYSYKIVNNPADYHGFGSDGFSYTQVNHDGTVETFTGTKKLSRPFQERVKMIHPLPAPVSKNPTPIEHPPPIFINLGKGHGFSYTQINNGGNITSIAEDRKVTVPAPVLTADTAPLRPIAVVDILQHKSRNPCKTNKKCKRPVSSGFSYTQIDGSRVAKITGDGQVIKPAFTETIQVPVAPAAVVDVIQPYAKPEPVVVEVGAKSPGSVMFEKPAVSNYVYRQISHTNPKPFTVVKVGNEPIVEVPVADVHVNPHKHVRLDGTKYLCTEFHKVAPDAPIPPLPTDKVVATIPDNLVYVPPLDVNVPFPTSHKIEVTDSGSHFTYTQLSSGSSTENSISTAEVPKEETIVEASSSDEPISFELNPIVVASEDMNYTYTQKNSDGSSLNIEGDKDNNVSVTLGDDDAKSTGSVTAKDSEVKTSDSMRGDIPAASS